eukprot:358456-Chlamydomonas_euryale.AAC.3
MVQGRPSSDSVTGCRLVKKGGPGESLLRRGGRTGERALSGKVGRVPNGARHHAAAGRRPTGPPAPMLCTSTAAAAPARSRRRVAPGSREDGDGEDGDIGRCGPASPSQVPRGPTRLTRGCSHPGSWLPVPKARE